METETGQAGAEQGAPATDEELADVLLAISVVSKRLARKLGMLKRKKEGGKTDERDE